MATSIPDALSAQLQIILLTHFPRRGAKSSPQRVCDGCFEKSGSPNHPSISKLRVQAHLSAFFCFCEGATSREGHHREPELGATTGVPQPLAGIGLPLFGTVTVTMIVWLSL